MGSLLSAASIARTVNNVKASKIEPTAITTLNANNSTAEEYEGQSDSTESQEQNLLKRPRRGRSSTIKTSLRGLLSSNNAQPARKSLLGE